MGRQNDRQLVWWSNIYFDKFSLLNYEALLISGYFWILMDTYGYFFISGNSKERFPHSQYLTFSLVFPSSISIGSFLSWIMKLCFFLAIFGYFWLFLAISGYFWLFQKYYCIVHGYFIEIFPHSQYLTFSLVFPSSISIGSFLSWIMKVPSDKFRAMTIELGIQEGPSL